MIEFISRLPQGYQEVEYIESSGTQYIDTGYKPTGENMRLVMDYMYPASPNGKSLFGAESSNTFSITFYSRSATTAEFFIGSTYDVVSYNITTGTRYKLDCHANNGAFTANLNEAAKSETYSGNLVKTINLFLFTNNGQQSTQLISARLYSCQIYDNEILIRDFVPCYRKADGAVGLYDLVNNVFYTNAGSGRFAVGSNISEIVITPGGVISFSAALRRRMMIKCDSKIEFEYTGNYTDNRDENGVGTVRFTSSGTLTVLSGTATVSAYILAGGGGCYVSSPQGVVSTGGGGGNQTIEVELSPGTYEITIGLGGAKKYHTATTSSGSASSGSDTIAFGYTSTGGAGGRMSSSTGQYAAGGIPNGGQGTIGGHYSSAPSRPGGSPNGGGYDSTQTNYANRAVAGGNGYVEITFS